MAESKTGPKTELMRPMTPQRQAAFEAVLKAMGKGRLTNGELLDDLHDLMALAFPLKKITIEVEW